MIVDFHEVKIVVCVIFEANIIVLAIFEVQRKIMLSGIFDCKGRLM